MSTAKWRDWLANGLSERCALCDSHTHGVALCSHCQASLAVVPTPCPVCALPAPGFCAHPPGWQLDGLCAPFVYAGSASTLVGRLKFDRRRWLGQVLGQLIQPYTDELGYFDLCFTIPLHRRRLAQRGFNQALAIAQGALPGARIAGGLHKAVDTLPQSQLGAPDRRSNLIGCFQLTRSVEHCRILLIDDVVTTGSTLNAIATLLRRQGATHVQGLAFARAVAAHSVNV